MDSRAVRSAIACVAIGAVSPALAQAQAQAQAFECSTPALQNHPLAERAAMLSSFEQMSEACLKAIFMDCGDAANRGILDLGSAASCSISYEALLKQGFGGDFPALLDWWRRERNTGVRN